MTAHESCSFCGKRRTRVHDLIAPKKSSAAYICDECIEVCQTILADDVAESKAAPTDSTAYFRPESGESAQTTQALHCSFCGRSQDIVSRLIASPRGNLQQYICDQCVGVSSDILSEAEDQELRRSSGLVGWFSRRFSTRAAPVHRMR